MLGAMGEKRNNGSESRPDVVCLGENIRMTSLCIEHHPCDSRIVLKGGVVQTLNERMGTGGGNVPLVLEIEDEDDDGGIQL